ncbi:choice-of-anchor A family protein [Streptomyces sp. NPDC053048]|uniref:choice-of-anchor A family protein n=1 Tax=Streptomyces sp. NPDC053048 TaxID=3365694 RepID=UPI0037D31EBB
MNAHPPRPPGHRAHRLWRAAVGVVSAVATVGGLAVPATAAPLPGGLGPCLPGSCPASHPAVGNGPFAGRDNNVNVFVGGDYRVRGAAAGAEGRVVTLGRFDLHKSSGGPQYGVGVTATGSRVPPADGTDFLTTGGAVTVAPGQRLDAERGVVRHAGPAEGTIVRRGVRDAAAAGPYTALRAGLAAASRCYAQGPDGRGRPATGTARNTGSETLFTGDGTSALQVFNVDFDLVGPGGTPQGIRFTRVPEAATVLVNLNGTARVVNTHSGGITDDSPFNRLRERLLWNLPEARRAEFAGTGQFQGSVLVGEPGSESTVTLPGMNGRFFTTGSLTHTSAPTGAGGQAFHAYPFTGNLPDCAGTSASASAKAQPTGAVSLVKRDAATARLLPGARFQLWRDTNGTPGLQTTGARPDTRSGGVCVTNAQGLCRRTVEPGRYFWQELQAPAGYPRQARDVFGPLALTVANAPRGVSVDVTNARPVPRGAVHLVKRDARTGRALAGAVFELWRETNNRPGLQISGAGADRRVGNGCATNRQGRCTFANQPAAAYYLRETAVPEGYRLPARRVLGPYGLTAANAKAGITVTARNTPGEPGKGK